MQEQYEIFIFYTWYMGFFTEIEEVMSWVGISIVNVVLYVVSFLGFLGFILMSGWYASISKLSPYRKNDITVLSFSFSCAS